MPSSQTAAPVNELAELKPTQLVPHKNNIRKDVGDVSTLADSLAAQGVIEPLQVVPNGKPDKYVILAGHRRQAAAKLAKLKTVPCIVRHDLTDNEPGQIAVMIAENVERSDLSAVEEAHGVQLLMDLGLSAAAIATSTGMSTKRVRERVKITKLSDDTRAKLADHAVTLADAVFIADHGKNEDDLDDLERALGTNNWAVTKQKVIDRVASRKREAKLLADIAKTGLTVIDDDWEAKRGKVSEISERLGCRRPELIERSQFGLRDWTPNQAILDAALAATANAFVFISRYTNAATAELRVYAAPAPETVGSDSPRNAPSETPHPAPDSDEDDVDREDESEAQRRAEYQKGIAAREARREAFAAATTVRRDFIAGVIAGGKLEHAQLAGQTAPTAGGWTEVNWGYLLPFLPIRNDHAGHSLDDDETYDVVTGWIDRQTNPYVLCLALAWVFLGDVDGHLTKALNPSYLDSEELTAIDRYALLLETCGYTFSDVELEGINAVREALAQQQESDSEDADG
ncbi:ParB/RepB/Spo0J family partition protein [Gordonia jacobaea]|uniref:ParB/RepB/Spo0J family partition protein n=1 Tax=Gordonia jacobaea TaxID=122202 RepID=UPI0022E40BFD|nr:ParB/RepB/Spo0J family partition protein [Gordonia jacobaea]